MRTLDYILMYLDDFSIITGVTFDNPLSLLETVLWWLEKAGLCLDVAKFKFAYDKIEYLGYIHKRVGTKPKPKK